MEKLLPAHIESIIDSESYQVTPQYIQCIIMVGEAPIIGTSYCFHQKHVDVELGRKAARRDAISKLFEFEAYHQKRLRPPVMTNDEPKNSDEIIRKELLNAEPRDVALVSHGLVAGDMLRNFLIENDIAKPSATDEDIKLITRNLVDSCERFLQSAGIKVEDLAKVSEIAKQIADARNKVSGADVLATASKSGDVEITGTIEGDLNPTPDHVHQGVSGMEVFAHAPEHRNDKVVREREEPTFTWVETNHIEVEPVPGLAPRICEYENRIRTGERGCVSILTAEDIVELNSIPTVGKPKNIYIDPELKLDLSLLEGYYACVGDRDGDFELA